MNPRRWTAATILLTLCLSAPLAAAPDSSSLENGADQVLEARRTGESLVPLATRNDPDPWLVAEILLARREREAAVAFGEAARKSHGDRLANYVASWRDAEGDGEIREAVGRARTFLEEKQPDAALAALEDARARDDSMLAAIVAYLRGESHEAAGRLAEGAESFGVAALAAKKLGWIRRAGFSCYRATRCAHVRSDLRTAIRWTEEGLRIWLARPDHPDQPYNESAARISLGGLLMKITEYGPARDHLRRALEILEPIRTKDLKHAAAHAGGLTNLALVHRSLGEYDEAVRLLERALALNRGYRYPPGIAWALANLGYTEWERGSPERGLTHLLEALPLMRSMKNGRGEALVLNWIGSARSRSGDTAGALEALRNALEVADPIGARWEKARARQSLGILLAATESLTRGIEHLTAARALFRDIGDTRSEAFVLSDLAKMLHGKGEVAQAREMLKEAIETAGEDRTARADALRNQGDLFVNQGEYEAATDAYANAAKLLEQTGNLAGRADLYNSEGGLAWRSGRLRDAVASFEKSLALNETIGDQDGRAGANDNLGLVHASLGNLTQALVHHEAALSIRVKTKDRVGEAGVRINLAIARILRGEAALALTHLERALDLARAGGDLQLEATARDNLGMVRFRIGDPAGAREEIDRSAELFEALGDRVGLARSWTNLATLHDSEGRSREARPLFEAALAEFRDVGAHGAAAQTQENLGCVLADLGDYDSARDHLLAARAAFVKQGARGGAAHCSANLAGHLFEQGKFDEAVDAYSPLLEEIESLGERRVMAFACSGLALALAGRGDHREAVAAARRAAEESRLIAGSFGEQQGAIFRSRVATDYEYLDVGARAALEISSAEDLCFFLETGRAGSLEEALHGRELLREAALPEDLIKAERNARLDEREAIHEHRLALATEKVDAIRESRRRLERRQEDLRAVVERIQRAQRIGAEIVSPRVDSLAEIQGSLRPGECLVAYGLHVDLVSALVVSPEAVRTVDLGEIASLERLCRGVLWVGRRGSRGVVVPGVARTDASSRTRSLAELRRRVIEPLGLGGKTRRLLISPTGILSYVPFRLLLDVPEIVHVPSGTTYRLLLDQRATGGKAVLALGDPDYAKVLDAGGLSVTAFEKVLPGLPGSRREVEAIGDVTLLGENATKRGLVKSLALRPRWKAVHLACHGLVHPEQPHRSALALTPDEADSGFLTYVDLCRLRIPADLVVLSACETARGGVYSAEGIVGLTSAFLHAGASTVLCSLWKVDDEATQALMVKFYELWRGKGLSVAAALAGAQEHVRSHEKWKDPYFWAAWVVWGRGD